MAQQQFRAFDYSTYPHYSANPMMNEVPFCTSAPNPVAYDSTLITASAIGPSLVYIHKMTHLAPWKQQLGDNRMHTAQYYQLGLRY